MFKKDLIQNPNRFFGGHCPKDMSAKKCIEVSDLCCNFIACYWYRSKVPKFVLLSIQPMPFQPSLPMLQTLAVTEPCQKR